MHDKSLENSCLTPVVSSIHALPAPSKNAASSDSVMRPRSLFFTTNLSAMTPISRGASRAREGAFKGTSRGDEGENSLEGRRRPSAPPPPSSVHSAVSARTLSLGYVSFSPTDQNRSSLNSLGIHRVARGGICTRRHLHEAAFARGGFEPPSCMLAPRGASTRRHCAPRRRSWRPYQGAMQARGRRRPTPSPSADYRLPTTQNGL